MSLIDRLRRLGGTLGIVHVPGVGAPAPAPGPAKLVMRVVSLADLAAAMPAPRPATAVLARSAAEISGDPTATSAWNAPRLAGALREPPFATLTGDELRAQLVAHLAAAGVAAEQVVADALARDHAIDTAAVDLRAQLVAARSTRAARRGELDAQLAALTSARAALDHADSADATAWAAWWQGKRAVEEDLARAIRPLIDRPLVSVDEAVPPLG